MFLHNYLYRLKCIIRDKQTMFWTLLFPILLGTLFNMTLANIPNAESFSEIKTAIVDNDEYKSNLNFINAIDSVSNPDKVYGSRRLFDVSYTSMEEADKLLDEGKVTGYIYFEDGINLVVRRSGINQTILKGFLDDYKQTASTVANIIGENPASVQGGLLNSISDRAHYLNEIAVSKSAPNVVIIYFYALIAMTCLYGSFLGLKEVTAVQANLSPQGARVNMAPTHKLKLFIAAMFAAVTVQLAEITILLGYLIIILKVDFGSQLGYIALTCIIGTMTGVSFGTCVSSIIKKGEGIKIAVLISFSMIMTFLSGLMFHDMKYIVSEKAPILGYLNPANLITDSLYSLYYYDSNTQLFMNLALLSAFVVFFSTITYFVLRRQKYANL